MSSRFRFRVWGVDYQQYMDDGEFVIDNNGELCATHADMLKVPQTSFIIEQCTGRADVNGKLIYEGDIVRAKLHSFGSKDAYYINTGVMCWNGLGFILQEKNSTCIIGNTLPGIEVIGNIHENPELMEG